MKFGQIITVEEGKSSTDYPCVCGNRVVEVKNDRWLRRKYGMYDKKFSFDFCPSCKRTYSVVTRIAGKNWQQVRREILNRGS